MLKCPVRVWLCDRARLRVICPQKNKPTRRSQPKNQRRHGLVKTKLTLIFTQPERSLKQAANCRLKTANNLKKLQEGVRLWRTVL
jgi:hypothetical protein